jgi:hypothetical protein
MRMSSITTTADTVDTTIQASVDGGSNWFQVGTFPQLTDDEDTVEVARPIYVPQPNSGQTRTKLRLNHVVSAGGSATVAMAWIEPMLSLAPPANDEKLTTGLALLT